MKPNDKTGKGIVIECYDHDANHRVLVIQSSDDPDAKAYHFLYIPIHPDVSFGDRILMDISKSKFYVDRGNPKLPFKLTTLTFPGDLLMELISEYPIL